MTKWAEPHTLAVFQERPLNFCFLFPPLIMTVSGSAASPSPSQPPVAAAIPELQYKVWLLQQEAAGPSSQRMIMTSEICCSLGNNRVLSLLENCVHQLTLLSY